MLTGVCVTGGGGSKRKKWESGGGAKGLSSRPTQPGEPRSKTGNVEGGGCLSFGRHLSLADLIGILAVEENWWL